MVNFLVALIRKLLYLRNFLTSVSPFNHFRLRKSQKAASRLISTSTTHITRHETLKLGSKTEQKKSALEDKVKKLVKANLKTPEKLLDCIEQAGTPVYRLKNADKILKLAGQEEGFIIPLKGIKALWLSIMLSLLSNKKCVITFNTPEMFVLKDTPVNIYTISHQFHKWYAYKMDLPGFEVSAQEKFARVWNSKNKNIVKDLSIEELLTLKDAIARDLEAIDFAINLSKETEGSANVLKMIANGEGGSV